MRMMREAAMLALMAGAGAVRAGPIELGGSVSARAGYGSNPFLQIGRSTGSAIGGVNLSPVLTYTEAKSKTSLSGIYDREQYLRRYGNAESYGATLSRRQELSEKFVAQGEVSYSSSTNPYIGNIYNPQIVNNQPVVQQPIDPLAIGTRSRRLDGRLDLTWQPTVRDGFNAGGSVSDSHYSGTNRTGFGLSDYRLYQANLGYGRSISAQTRVGVSVAATKTDSEGLQDVSAIQPNLTLAQQFNQYWQFRGGIGVIFQRVRGLGLGPRSSTSLGFNASLCGSYPRTSLCLQASRQTDASGFGGARTSTSGSIVVTQKLTGRDTVSADFSYTDSDSVANILLASQRVTAASLNYDRKLTARLSAGLSGRYQVRTLDNGGGVARGAAGLATVTYLIGRTTT